MISDSHSSRSRDQSIPSRHRHRLGPIPHVQLRKDVADMIGRGVFGNTQVLSDFMVLPPDSDQFQDLDLALRQPVGAAMRQALDFP